MVFEIVVILLGLLAFEIVNSMDNAIVNAHVLKTMSALWRRRFLIMGVLTSVFLVRFMLPLAIVWFSVPGIDLGELFSSFTLGNEVASQAVEANKHLILVFGGVFLLFLYFHWLFLEKKPDKPLFLERFLRKEHGVWFFGFAAIILVAIMYFARADPMMMLAAAVGSAAFFILYGFKQTAEEQERKLEKKPGVGDLSKFMYLEVLDTTFSFDGVIGAFAFTTNLLLIVIGIGVGALVVREMTIRGIDHVAKYKWLKNGAMTSIGFLGLFMVLESFGLDLPVYIPTAVTFSMIGIAFWKSRAENRKPI
jgi:hypothetical protein